MINNKINYYNKQLKDIKLPKIAQDQNKKNESSQRK